MRALVAMTAAMMMVMCGALQAMPSAAPGEGPNAALKAKGHLRPGDDDDDYDDDDYDGMMMMIMLLMMMMNDAV